MAIELLKEKCLSPVNVLTIGMPPAEARIGGETCMPFLFDEGAMPHAPAVALEIFDCEPSEWPDHLVNYYRESLKDPVRWAKKCLADSGAKALCVRAASVHPDNGGRGADKAAAAIKAIAESVRVPLVIVGSGDDERDNEVMPKVSQALKGMNCMLGFASQNNYKTITATALADGHSLIAESPIDVNIAKQLNILISDMGFDPARIAMHPTTASLGYGSEYVYSIMERARLAAFIGDKMLSMPFVLFAGAEVWRTKEAKESTEAQAVNWEIATAVSMLQAGGDLVVMRHPAAAKAVGAYIGSMMMSR
jgi:acetyl-CoA decarbonylase/synthase complex subunit delta